MHGRVDIQVGTLSKAIGALGGYVAGSRALIDFLYHRARPFLFSTSHPPSVAATLHRRARRCSSTSREIIDRLWDNTRFFKQGLETLGFNTGLSESPITPVIVGEGRPAMKLSDRLFAEGRVRAGHRVSDRRARQGARARRSSPRPTRSDELQFALDVFGKVGPGTRPDLTRRHGTCSCPPATAGDDRPGPPGSAHRARSSSRSTRRTSRPSDLQRLFTRDTREAYGYFSRGIDRDRDRPAALARARCSTYTRLFFIAFTMRLSPARRALYAVALIATVLGLLELFAGVELHHRSRASATSGSALPVPMWHDGVICALHRLRAAQPADHAGGRRSAVAQARPERRARHPARDAAAGHVPRRRATRCTARRGPANTVGGDFYDMLPLADGRLVIALGDVAGKGSPAALLMALLLAMLRTLVDEGLAPGR